MVKFISPTGAIVKARTIKEFADQQGLRYSHAKDLACGLFKRHKGWCSTHSRAKKARERFLTVLIHPRSGRRRILGQCVKKFAHEEGLNAHTFGQLVNGRKFVYRGWMTEQTHRLAQGTVTDIFF
jgi:hypothetical protein